MPGSVSLCNLASPSGLRTCPVWLSTLVDITGLAGGSWNAEDPENSATLFASVDVGTVSVTEIGGRDTGSGGTPLLEEGATITPGKIVGGPETTMSVVEAGGEVIRVAENGTPGVTWVGTWRSPALTGGAVLMEPELMVI